MRVLQAAVVILVSAAPVWPQAARLKTADAVLGRYQQALGGVAAIEKVQSETVRGEVEATGMAAKATFVYQAKPFKFVLRVKRPDGVEITQGFDGKISWVVTPKGASIDQDTAVEALRRDADLRYALHQPDYFRNLELSGITDFEGHRCYWLHGTTHWGKDNNQYYDVETGLLVGYRFQADSSSPATATQLFQDYRSFGGPLVATTVTSRTGDRTQTFTYTSVSYEPVADSVFELPEAVRAILK